MVSLIVLASSFQETIIAAIFSKKYNTDTLFHRVPFTLFTNSLVHGLCDISLFRKSISLLQYKITIIIIPAMYRPHLFILIYKRMVRLSSPLFMRWDYIGWHPAKRMPENITWESRKWRNDNDEFRLDVREYNFWIIPSDIQMINPRIL